MGAGKKKNTENFREAKKTNNASQRNKLMQSMFSQKSTFLVSQNILKMHLGYTTSVGSDSCNPCSGLIPYLILESPFWFSFLCVPNDAVLNFCFDPPRRISIWGSMEWEIRGGFWSETCKSLHEHAFHV